MAQLGRRLFAAANPAMRHVMRRYGMRLGATRFVCGERIEECVAAIVDLNRRGFKANATILGEGVADPARAAAAVIDYETLIHRLADEGLNANVAVKLSLLGLPAGVETARENLVRLATTAAARNLFVRVDMEASDTVDITLTLYRELRAAGHRNVGIVLQSCLRRTEADLETLLPLNPNLRLVKGAYLEPRAIAYARKREVDAAYVRLLERSLTAGGYTAIATDDQCLGPSCHRLRRTCLPPARPVRVPDAVRRAPRASATVGRGRVHGAGRDLFRPQLVSVLHATAGGAARECAVSGPKPVPLAVTVMSMLESRSTVKPEAAAKTSRESRSTVETQTDSVPSLTPTVLPH